MLTPVMSSLTPTSPLWSQSPTQGSGAKVSVMVAVGKTVLGRDDAYRCVRDVLRCLRFPARTCWHVLPLSSPL
jgi:hypothetical protein